MKKRKSFLSRTGFHLFHFSCFSIFMIAVLSSCFLDAQPSHPTYIYSLPDQKLDGHKHVGDHIHINWVAQSGPATSETLPAKVVLNVELIGGPFSSIDAILSAIRQSQAQNNSFKKDAVLVSAEPINTDDWTKRSFVSTITILSHLKTGYYDLFETITTFSGEKSKMTRSDAFLYIN